MDYMIKLRFNRKEIKNGFLRLARYKYAYNETTIY